MLSKNIIKALGLKNTSNFLLISGPCVVESRDVVFRTCGKLKEVTTRLKIPFVFKASYQKANRTSGKSFRGIGMEEALSILAAVKKKFDVPILTDVHSEIEVDIVSEFVDIIQIPAFLSRQTELLETAGESGKVVNIKKGQFMAPGDMKYQADKVASTGNNKVMLTERGTTFGYNNLVVDMRSLAIMKKTGYPVIFDATHSVQMPSGGKGVSAGTPEFIPVLSRAAAAAGVDGFFMETHPNPAKALSDGSNMMKLSDMEKLLTSLLQIHKLVNK